MGRRRLSVTILLCTHGEQGVFDDSNHEQMPAIREREQVAASAVLGVKDVRFLQGHRDGWLEPSWKLQRQIIEVIRDVQPQCVLIQFPEPAGRAGVNSDLLVITAVKKDEAGVITDFAIDVRAGSRSWMSSGFVFEEVNVDSRIAVGTGVDRTYLHAVHRAPAKRGPYLRPAATSPRPTTWTDYRSPSTENAPRAAASRQPPLSAEAVTPQSCHRPTSRPNPRPSACQRDRGPKISILNRHFRAFKHSVSSRRVNDPG